MTGSVSPVDPKDLLVSDAEREHVVKLLNRAVGHGMLTLDEFTERTDTALNARTRGQLNVVLIDLPGLTVSGQPWSAIQRAEIVGDSLELRQTASSLKRRGQWVVPRQLVVSNRLGSMLLDFTQAHIPHRDVTIDLENDLGSVTAILPEGSTVDVDRLNLTMSSIKNKVPAQTHLGTRHFVFTGRMAGSSLTLKLPRSYWIGPYRLQRPFRITRR